MGILSDFTKKIRNAIYVKDVRDAIADGLETVEALEEKNLETYNNMVIGAGESNAEIVDARLDNTTGKRYEKVGKRLDKISSEIDEKTNLLNARMDTFTKLEEGSTTGDAELADGRVGANGVTYENIGNAIRGQVSEIEDELTEVKGIVGEVISTIYDDTISNILSVENGKIATNNNSTTHRYIGILSDVVSQYYSLCRFLEVKNGTSLNTFPINKNETTVVFEISTNNNICFSTSITESDIHVALIDVTNNKELEEYILLNGYSVIGKEFGGTLRKIATEALEVGKEALESANKSTKIYNVEVENIVDSLRKEDVSYDSISMILTNQERAFCGIEGFENNKIYILSVKYLVDGYYYIRTLSGGSYRKKYLNGEYRKAETEEYIIMSELSSSERLCFSRGSDGFGQDFAIGVYDVTNLTEEQISTVDWSNVVSAKKYTISNLPDNTIKGENICDSSITNKKLITNYYGKIFSGLGDSLTAIGSGGIYLNEISKVLHLSAYKNCGIGGTRVSGNGDTCFWQDVRVEALDLGSQVVTIMGGTNDAPYTTVSDADFTSSNHNTDNFVGAYNVLLSKVFYKFLKLEKGYYSDIDYSNLTQVDVVNENFRIVLITPPQSIDNNNSKHREFGEYVKRIGEMWGLPVVDAFGEMQMNFMTYPSDREDKVHFPIEFHKKLAEITIGKLKSIEPYE